MAGTTPAPFGAGTGAFGLLQRHELLESLKQLYKSSEYGDLMVLCGEECFRVHKALVFPRAKLLAQYVAKGDGPTTIHLDEDSEMIKRLLDYLYTLDYDDSPKHSAPALPAPPKMPVPKSPATTAKNAAASAPPTATLSAAPPTGPAVMRAASAAPDTSFGKPSYAQVAPASNGFGSFSQDSTKPSLFTGMRSASVAPTTTSLFPQPMPWGFGSTVASTPVTFGSTLPLAPAFGTTSAHIFGQRAASVAPTTSTQPNAATPAFSSMPGSIPSNKPPESKYLIPAKRGSSSNASEFPPAKRAQTTNTATALVQAAQPQNNGTAGIVTQRPTSVTWTPAAAGAAALFQPSATTVVNAGTLTGPLAQTHTPSLTQGTQGLIKDTETIFKDTQNLVQQNQNPVPNAQDQLHTTQNLTPDIFQKHPLSLSINAHMYALAYKYGINGLKILAKGKFSFGAKDRFQHPEFPRAIEVVFTSTPESDVGLRDVVVGVIADNLGGGLIGDKEIERVMRKFSGLSWGVLRKKFST